MNKYTVTGPTGEIITILNERLAIIQGVSPEQLEALILSHQLRWMIFDVAKKSLDKPLKLKMLAGVFDALEFEQQELWNFPRDANHHYFFDFPGCTCPKIDNRDRLGTPGAIHDLSCPIHGGTYEDEVG